mgnify:CR=1 FL=1
MKQIDHTTITIAVLQVDIYDGSIYLGNADYISAYYVSTVVSTRDGELTDLGRKQIADLAKKHTRDPWECDKLLQGRVCRKEPTYIKHNVRLDHSGQTFTTDT